MNVLPDEYKKRISDRRWRQFVLYTGTLVAVALASATTLLLPSYFYLAFTGHELSRAVSTLEGSARLKEAADVIARADALGTRFARIREWERREPALSGVLDDLFGRVPSGVAFSSFSYDRAKHELSIRGVSTTRAALDAFDAALDASSYVKSASYPLSDLLAQKDLEFTMTVILQTP